MDTAATERVGRYQLLEPIGTGPNGSVWRAKVFGVAGFERQFAVKKFFPELTITASNAQTLSQAARAYGGLEHPRIARMAEFGVAGGTTFTAVELVTGLDALRLINETRLAGMALPVGGALGLVSQAARAVGYAHGRGLSHLGLSPTNVLVSADGDIKITDFNILQATLPVRPAAGPWQDGPIGGLIGGRLANRVMYLAPEQISGEPTSAATDVWSLGVLGYELVTGQRAFRGETPTAIATAIMSSSPIEPQLPRPIVRVLQRCLARSPFERFPDARALADAIDAAIRVAPVPGTRKDLGALVGEMLDRIAALHDGEMSGVLAINPGTGPFRRESMPDVPTLGRDSAIDLSTGEFVRPDLPVAGPTPLVSPGKAPTTMPGVVPPIPPIGPRPVTQPPPIPATTLMGLPSMPAVPRERPQTALKFGFNPTTNTGVGAAPRAPAVRPTDEITPLPQPPHHITAEIPPGPAARLGAASTMPTGEIEPLVARARQEIAGPLPPPAPIEPSAPQITYEAPPPEPELDARRTSKVWWIVGGLVLLGGLGFVGWQIYDVMQTDDRGAGSAVAKAPGDAAAASDAAKVAVVAPVDAGKPGDAGKPSDAAKIAAVADAASPPDAAKIAAVADAAVPADATKIAVVPADATKIAVPADAAKVAVVADAAVPADAAKVAVVADAGVAVVSTGDANALFIDSTPHGARVFLDGKDVGETPIKLAALPAKHNVALVLAAHDLYVASIDGHGTFTVPLKDIPPWKGNAGIKLLKCTGKDRYYVYVDGKPTGMTCPTERINTTMGPHVVEVYDAQTDSKKKWDVNVPDERLSLRVRVEP